MDLMIGISNKFQAEADSGGLVIHNLRVTDLGHVALSLERFSLPR